MHLDFKKLNSRLKIRKRYRNELLMNFYDIYVIRYIVYTYTHARAHEYILIAQ